MTRRLIGELITSDEAGFACSKTRLVERGLPHLRPFNIGDDALDLSQVYQVSLDEAPAGKTALLAGDILFNNTNSAELVGKSALIGDSMSAGFSNHMTRIRLDTRQVAPGYFAFWLRRLRGSGYFTRNATQWVSQAAYKTSELRKLTIDIPSLAEQCQVVDVLSRAEGIVRLRREAQRKATELIPAIFLEMFGDPSTNPRAWPTRAFGNVGALDRGKSRNRPRDAPELYGGPYPFIQTGDIANSGGRVTRYSSTYSELGLSQSKLWPRGTLCITIAANIAKTGVLEFDACFPDSVVGFLPGETVRTEFVQAWLHFLQPTLEANAPQAAQKNINLDILRRLPIPTPPVALQDRFEQYCRDVFALRSQQGDSLVKAIDCFDALLARSFYIGN